MSQGVFISTLSLLMLIYSTGFFISVFFMRGRELAFNVLTAIPLGLGLWSISWISARLIGLPHDFGFSSVANNLSVVLYVLVIVVFLFLSLKQDISKRAMLGWWVLGAIVILAFAWAYLQFSTKTILGGDSYRYVDWASDPMHQLRSGYTLISLSWTNLATLLGADQLLGVVYPLLALSLSLLIFYAIMSSGTESFTKTDRYIAVSIIAFCLVSLFVVNRMFLIQSHYINHHSFVASILLAMTYLLFYSSQWDGRRAVLVGLLVLLASMARMEGFLYALMLLVLAMFAQKERKGAPTLLIVTLVINSPYLLFLMLLNWDSGFVEGWQYAVMLAGGMLALLLLRLPDQRLLRAPMFHLSVPVFLLAFIAAAIWLKPTHMLNSLHHYTSNIINPEWWGLLTLISLPLIAVLVFRRFMSKESWRPTDVLIVWVVSAILLIFSLTFWRSPLRSDDWSDSANRMLFHLFPVMVLWMGIELSRLWNAFSQKRGLSRYGL